MIYIYHRNSPTYSNYLNKDDRDILSWQDYMQEENKYSSLILHRYKLPKGWTKTHNNRYQYKNILDLKTNLIKEDNIILLHYPDKVEDVYQLLKDPNLKSKDFWLFGLKTNPHYSRKEPAYYYDLSNLGLEFEIVDNLHEYLESLTKIIGRDKKLEKIFNI
jgi:hypothetical protein